MAKRRKPDSAKLNMAAERTGRALGQLARTFDAVRSRHPRPLEEAREALAAGRKRVAKAGKAVAKKTRKVVKLAKKAVTRSRKAATRARKTVTRVTRLKR